MDEKAQDVVVEEMALRDEIDDSPSACEKFDRADFEWMCDEFERGE